MAENVSGHIPVKTLVLKDAPVREVPNGAIALVDENGDPINIGGGVQPGDLAAVATSGEYGDLLNPPTLGTAASADTGDFLAAPAGAVPAYSVDPADLAAALVRAGLMQAGGD